MSIDLFLAIYHFVMASYHSFAEQFRSKSLGEFLEMFQTGIWLEELDPVVSTNEWIRG